MKSIVLKSANGYPSHIVYMTSNNFGDQVLKLRVESDDGSVKEFTQTNIESNHIPFTPAAMLQSFAPEIESVGGVC